jgi:polysaccharide biosynthesis/export protein
MSSHLRLFLSFCLLFLLCAACASQRDIAIPVANTPQILQAEGRFTREYVLAVGDQIEVVVRRAPEVSRIVVIRPDGFISLPLLDDIKASGLTINELDTRLTELFSGRLLDPEVTIIGTQLRQPMVYVLGDTANVAAIPLRNAPTAIQAITAAGGLRRTAASERVAIVRLSEDGILRAIPIVVEKDTGQTGLYLSLRTQLLQADDIIFVPESGRSQFARALEDFVTRPLFGINSAVGTYLNFKFVEAVSE